MNLSDKTVVIIGGSQGIGLRPHRDDLARPAQHHVHAPGQRNAKGSQSRQSPGADRALRTWRVGHSPFLAACPARP